MQRLEGSDSMISSMAPGFSPKGAVLFLWGGGLLGSYRALISCSGFRGACWLIHVSGFEVQGLEFRFWGSGFPCPRSLRSPKAKPPSGI